MHEGSAGLEQALLQAWDDGVLASPGERGLLLLRLVFPALSEQARGDLTVGRRDEALLGLHERLFGGVAGALATCATCGETLEFDLALRDIRVAPAEPAAEPFHLEWGGQRIAYRLPRAADLAAVGRAGGGLSVAAAAEALARRCILASGAEAVAIPEGAAGAVEIALADRVPQADPQAVVMLDFACQACGAPGRAPFDIVTFLWRRLDAFVRGLLRDVHVLASQYGWTERDIVALPPWRRRHYLALIGA
jgi:hypothetical protein